MSTTPRKILIIEDDPDIVLTLATIFEEEGYRVSTVDNGAHLTPDRLASDPPSLIVLDMLLSGSDGRDITRQLKAHTATSHIPILMLSAHPMARQEAQASGADAFLAKPFELDTLLEKTTALLAAS